MTTDPTSERPETVPPIAYEERFIATNGIQLHVVLAGPEDGQPLLFLHGFPEFWYGWKQQIPYFAQRGYRVIVPDQRGYNTSDKPAGIDAYHIDNLIADVAGLLDALGYEQVHLVAHDWGGFVAWYFTEQHAARVKKLTILNVPNVRVFAQAIVQRNWEQLKRIWYAYAFLIPWLPEALLRRQDYQGMISALALTTDAGTFDTPEMQRNYKAAWSQTGALTGMVNWYRALFRLYIRKLGKQPLPKLETPVLLIWGKLDNTMYIGLAQPSADISTDGNLIVFEDATHWAQHDKPNEVNQLIADFIGVGV